MTFVLISVFNLAMLVALWFYLRSSRRLKSYSSAFVARQAIEAIYEAEMYFLSKLLPPEMEKCAINFMYEKKESLVLVLSRIIEFDQVSRLVRRNVDSKVNFIDNLLNSERERVFSAATVHLGYEFAQENKLRNNKAFLNLLRELVNIARDKVRNHKSARSIKAMADFSMLSIRISIDLINESVVSESSESLIKLVEDGKLGIALEHLKGAHHDANLISALIERYTNLRRKEHLTTESNESLNIERSRIRQAVLDLINPQE